jgi:hypothetical protein
LESQQPLIGRAFVGLVRPDIARAQSCLRRRFVCTNGFSPSSDLKAE